MSAGTNVPRRSGWPRVRRRPRRMFAYMHITHNIVRMAFFYR